jgi:transposase
LVAQILASRPHPEQGYRSCLGLLRLAKQYGPARVEAASGRAVAVGARSYRHVETMLKHGLDRVPLEADDPPPPRAGHANVRGPRYYQQELPHAD